MSSFEATSKNGLKNPTRTISLSLSLSLSLKQSPVSLQPCYCVGQFKIKNTFLTRKKNDAFVYRLAQNWEQENVGGLDSTLSPASMKAQL